MSSRKRLVLVGGGHAHVEVLRQLAHDPIAGLATCVIADRRHAIYSGMVPGFAAGQYTASEIEVDVAALAAQAGAEWIEARACEIDAEHQRISLVGHSAVDYDIGSLDVGSTVAGLDTPGVRAHALASRPIAELVERVNRLRRAPEPNLGLVVVGGGAAGVELAFCLRERLRAADGSAPRTRLIEAGPHILAGASAALRRTVERAAQRAGIELRCNARVAAVDAGGVDLVDGARVAGAAVVWVTGAAPHPFVQQSRLPLDDTGFVRVEPTLAVSERPNLFAVGDCASVPGAAKAGVYAVRQGPVLAANLRALHTKGPLETYTPQRDFLRLLNLGDGSAIAAKWGLALRGDFALRWKDRIDRRWMARYAPEPTD